MGLSPKPSWGFYSVPPDSVSELKRPASNNRGGERREGRSRLALLFTVDYAHVNNSTIYKLPIQYVYDLGRAGFKGERGPGPSPPTNRGPPTKPFIFLAY